MRLRARSPSHLISCKRVYDGASSWRNTGSPSEPLRRASSTRSRKPTRPPLPIICRSFDNIVFATRQPSPRGPSCASLGNAHVGEEHLVEVRRARDLAQGPHVDPRRAHVEQERGDALVLGLRRDRCAPGADPSRCSARPTSRPSARSRSIRRRRATARVRKPARSEPAPGSEKSWHQISSPCNIAGRKRPAVRAVPHAMIVGPAIADADREHADRDVVASLFLVEDALLPARAAAATGFDGPRDPGPATVEQRRAATPCTRRCACRSASGDRRRRACTSAIRLLARACAVPRARRATRAPRRGTPSLLRSLRSPLLSRPSHVP